MQNQLHPDVSQYLELNGFKRQNKNITNNTVFIKGANEAIVLTGINIIYKQNLSNDTVDITGVLFRWQTVKKYIGFDGKNMFHFMLILHVMDAINIKDINRRLHNQAKGHILHQCVEMMLQPETAHA